MRRAVWVFCVLVWSYGVQGFPFQSGMHALNPLAPPPHTTHTHCTLKRSIFMHRVSPPPSLSALEKKSGPTLSMYARQARVLVPSMFIAHEPQIPSRHDLFRFFWVFVCFCVQMCVVEPEL